MITRGQVPATESANVIRDVCNAVAGTPPHDPAIAVKEQAWQDYYQGCGGDYQQFEASFRNAFEQSWRETGAKPDSCG